MTPKRVQNGSQNDPLGALGAHWGTVSKKGPYFVPNGRHKVPKWTPKWISKSTYFWSNFEGAVWALLSHCGVKKWSQKWTPKVTLF